MSDTTSASTREEYAAPETLIAVVGQDWEKIVEAARKGEPGERIVVNMGPQH
ncbi:MAG: NADH dehydrogenase subunit D, partial [Mycobacterium sp.]